HMLIEKRTQSVVDTLDSETIQINLEREASFDFSSVENITSSSLFSLSGFEEHHAIGVIYSPEIEMEVPIFKGLSNTDLFVGAGAINYLLYSSIDQEIGTDFFKKITDLSEKVA